MENYKVRESNNLIDLQKLVNKLIEKDWIPIGGVSNFGDTHFEKPRYFYQTLIKKEIKN